MVVLSHDGQRFVVLFSEDYSNDPRFMVKLSRYFDTSGVVCYAKENTTPNRIRSLREQVERFAESKGVQFEVDRSFEEALGRMENQISERFNVGRGIKRHDPKVEKDFEEFSSVVNSIISSRPLRSQQMWDSFFLCAMERAANFSVPGSGKTASTYGMFCFLRYRGLAKRMIVISPINAFDAWIEEYYNCFGCNPRYFSIQEQKGKDDLEKKLKYDSGAIEIFLFNYESIPRYADIIRDNILDDKTIVVFDEAHRIKSTSGKRATASIYAVRDAKYIVALTGTPLPNSYEDLYNLLSLIYGDNYWDLINITPAHLKKPSQDVVVKVNEHLYPFYCRTDKESLGVPAANEDVVVRVDATDLENELFNELMIMDMNPLARIVRILQMESDPGMLLRRVDSKTLEAFGVKSEVLPAIGISIPTFESTKVARCVDLVSDLVSEGKAVIVWCIFLKSINIISRKLRKRGISVEKIFGAVSPDDRTRVLSSFRGGEFKVLISNPQTLAESVSLHTVCHDAVYFEYGFNLVHLLQSKDRIHRLGLPDNQYTQYYYLDMHYMNCGLDKSLDASILKRLAYKEKLMLDAINNETFEEMPTEDEDYDAVLGPLMGVSGDDRH